MKVLRRLLQILLAAIYSFIYADVMYFATIFPAGWFVSLSALWKIIVLTIFLGVIEGVIKLLQVFGSIPFMWLSRDNAVSTGLATAIFGALTIRNAVLLWQAPLGHGAWAIVLAVMLTVFMIQFFVSGIAAIIGGYKTSN